MGVAGDGARLVRQAGAGLTAHPGDPIATASALHEMLRLGKEGRSVMGQRAKDYYDSSLSVDAGLRRYGSIFHEVAAGRKGMA